MLDTPLPTNSHPTNSGRRAAWTLLLLPPLALVVITPRAQAQDTKAEPERAPANRLAGETSPYLLMHAHNPVNWYPWGEEALAKARRENKVIFLSVGYSSCHWCHVMERESFLDQEIAVFLNEHFVCVKVDREERPDVDAIYMTAVQIYNQVTTGQRGGGWPMSVFLTPDALPFFGGTYFPARDGDRGARMGFLTLIRRVNELWGSQRDNIQRDAQRISDLVKSELDGRRPADPQELAPKLLDEMIEAFEDRFDETHGGFGYDPLNPRAPKFPEPSNLMFLLDRMRSPQVDDSRRAAARRMALTTLRAMAQGGIRDHLGGGFHRYSTDRFWRVPHFEKMLYDNAQLATVYAEAFAETGDVEFRRVVDEVLEFVEREMTAPEGGFYSALDAESEGEEGKFYRWSRDETRRVLGEDQYKLFAAAYGVDRDPNFEERYYVLELKKPLEELAAEHQLTRQELDARLSQARANLLEARQSRPRPITDTKVLTSWNGLMIRGYADAGRALNNTAYLDASRRGATFVLERMRTDEGRLLRTYGQGHAKLNAYLDDYAFLVDGLIALHRATGEKRWLDAADEVTAKQLEWFWDDRQGGFFFTSEDHESLLARGRDPVDGVEPSGNSVSADNLWYLAQHLNRPDYRDKARRTVASVAGLLQTAPHAAPRMALVWDKLRQEEDPAP